MSSAPAILQSYRQYDDFVALRRRLDRAAFLAENGSAVLVLAPKIFESDAEKFGTCVMQISPGSQPTLLTTTVVIPVVKLSTNLFSDIIWVGRTPKCDICLPFDSVSKLHAQITRRSSGEYQIMDAGSTNGTFVGKLRLAKDQPQVLRNGDMVAFGNIESRFLTSEGFCDELAAKSGAKN